jgi:collagenase-like PrtC family protease
MEILSPAGDLTHIELAIEKKVDAVYGGLKKWNARNKAKNFTITEYNKVIKRLRKNNIKFYLTLNTIVFDEEIEEIISFLKNKNNQLPDAFIVADIGLSIRLKKEFPDVQIHMSTQFGAHTIEDLKFLKDLYVERVILARELNYEEIANLKRNSTLDLEAFVWGTQCMSYSGLCFFNSLINCGNANRGKCVTACRDIYVHGDKKGHLLYMPDLNCVNLLKNDENINCIKIEGRRRNSLELAGVIDNIRSNNKPLSEKGFVYGLNVKENGLFELINSRIKPLMKASDLKTIDPYDVFIDFDSGKPLFINDDSFNENTYYVFSEYKNEYLYDKNNVSFEFKIDNDVIKEVFYINSMGESKTIKNKENILVDDYEEFDLNKFVKKMENINNSINIYKIKYERNYDNEYKLSKKMLNRIISQIKLESHERYEPNIEENIHLENIFLETRDLNVINEFIKDPFVKLIYDIGSVKTF